MSVMEPVMEFFDAIERGRGWEVCRQWCAPDAAFSCQAKSLDDVKTLEAYADWMAATCKAIPDAHYDLKRKGMAEDGTTVMAYAVFLGTSKSKSGKSFPIAADYVYVIETDAGKVSRMTKIWNDRAGA